MKVIGIVGFKKSGKTDLALKLCEELKRRGRTVMMIKHSDSELLPGEVDSTRMANCAGQSVVISRAETVLSFKREMPLEEALTHMKGDVAIIEGFKNEKTFPRIVCLRDKAEAVELFNGLQVCVVGSGEDLGVPLLEDIVEIADLVETRSFKLPDLNCGACGYETCFELAGEIVKGEKAEDDCSALHSETVVKVDGEVVALGPFPAEMIAHTVRGLITALKGVREGSIEIEIR